MRQDRRACNTPKSSVYVIMFLGAGMIIGMLMLGGLTLTIILVASRSADSQTTIGIITACAGMLAAFGSLTGQAIGSLSSMLNQTNTPPALPLGTPGSPLSVQGTNAPDAPTVKVEETAETG